MKLSDGNVPAKGMRVEALEKHLTGDYQAGQQGEIVFIRLLMVDVLWDTGKKTRAFPHKLKVVGETSPTHQLPKEAGMFLPIVVPLMCSKPCSF